MYLTIILNHVPTGPNPRASNKSALLDIILTNTLNKYTSTGIFWNNVSDYCAIACVRKTKINKDKPHYIFERHFRQFDVQVFLHDLYHNIERVSLIPDVDTAWDYFILNLC
jgi:hypothetical protein